jgi:DNA-binding protein YbaB
VEQEIERLLADIHAQRERVLEIQRSVQRMEFAGQAAGGEVTVRVRGTGELIEVCIDPPALRRYDADTLGGLVVEAVNDALHRLADAGRRRFGPMLTEAGA